MKFQPLQLGRRPEPFSHEDWLFEIKYAGCRALAQIEHGWCKLVAHKGGTWVVGRPGSAGIQIYVSPTKP